MDAVLCAAKRFASSADLAEQFQLGKMDPNKVVIYRKALPHGPDSLSSTQPVTVAKWRQHELSLVKVAGGSELLAARTCIPPSLPAQPLVLPDPLPDIYQYPASTPDTIHWHVNFANLHLIWFYASQWLPQDELQMAEMPALAHLREALVTLSADEAAFTPKNRDDDNTPTPFTVSGVQRMVEIHTEADPENDRPVSIYGDAFQDASAQTVEKATEVCQPPIISHILAMEAGKYGSGFYTKEQVSIPTALQLACL